MSNLSKKEKRIGEINISNEGYKMKIIEYKDLIPTKLYEALYRYEVEIND